MIMFLQMDAAQQYNTNGRGYPPLLDWAKQHTEDLHAPPAGQEVVITSGSNHAIDVSLPRSFWIILHHAFCISHHFGSCAKQQKKSLHLCAFTTTSWRQQ